MNEIAIRNTLPVKSMAEIEAIGVLFERSGMFGCTQQGQGIILSLACVMEGKTPIELLETYHIINGKLSKRADAMLVDFIKLGGIYSIDVRNENEARAMFKFKSAMFESSFTWEQAKKEPFVYEKDGKTPKYNWATPRARMQTLWARVVSDGVRTVCPLANRGTIPPEEAQDLPEETETTIIDEPVIDLSGLKVVKPETKPEPEKKPEQPATATAPEAAPEVEAEIVDFNIIPIGDLKGQPWTVLQDVQLAKLLNFKGKKLTDGHRKAIQAEIDKRKAATNVQ